MNLQHHIKDHWMLYAAIAGGAFIAYKLYAAGKVAGTAAPPPLTPGQQALQTQDAALLNQLAQPDYNPLNYVAGTAPTPGANPINLVMLGLAFAGLYMFYGGKH